MDQPLWQNYLNLGLIAFVARRAGIGWSALATDAPSVLEGVYVGVLVVCVLAGIGVWLRRAWVMASISILALAFGIQTTAELISESRFAAWWLVTQWVFAWLVSGLALFLASRAGSDSVRT